MGKFERVPIASQYIVTAGDQTNGYAVFSIITGRCILRNLSIQYPINCVSIDCVINRKNQDPILNGIPMFQGLTPNSDKDWLTWNGFEAIPDNWEVVGVVYPCFTGDAINIRGGIDLE